MNITAAFDTPATLGEIAAFVVAAYNSGATPDSQIETTRFAKSGGGVSSISVPVDGLPDASAEDVAAVANSPGNAGAAEQVDDPEAGDSRVGQAESVPASG